MIRRPVYARLRPELLEDRLAPAAAGSLDPSFGTGGIYTFPSESENGAGAVALQPDGKIVVLASELVSGGWIWFATRLTVDGRPDPTFGSNGKTELPMFESSALGRALIRILSDGSILVTGAGASFEGYGVARLLPDGQLDTDFGTGGTAPPGVAVIGPYPTRALETRADGRILLVGISYGAFQPPAVQVISFAAVQLTAGGQLDPGFGSGGVVTVPFPIGEFNNAEPAGVALLPDGRAVIAGGAAHGVHTEVSRMGQAYGQIDTDFAAVRLTPDGQLDSTFGDGGRVRVSFDRDSSNWDQAEAVGVQPDGRVVLAGQTGTGRLRNGIATVRLTADGRLDPTYGTGGKTQQIGETTYVDAMAVLPDGRVVFADNQGGHFTRLIRLEADGRIDAAFGPTLDRISVTGGAVMQPDGNILFTAADVIRVLGRASPVPISPGSFLAGGSPDGFARPIEPSGVTIAPTEPIEFFPGFPGTVRTATADVTGDGVPDLVGGAGPGGGPHVRVFDGQTGRLVGEVFAFEGSFTGGVYVAAADLTGDGKADLVVTPDQGGGPVVAVYDGAKLTPLPLNGGAAAQLTRYFGIEDADFRGGARPAVGDVTGDGTPDVVIAAGFLGGPRVTIWDGQSVLAGRPTAVANFFAFEDTLRNGTFVAAGDVTGDGRADLAFGGGPGGGPRVRLFDGKQLLAAAPFAMLDDVSAAQRANFFAGNAALRGGVRLALRDADGDGKADLTTGSGDGEPSRVRVYTAPTLLAAPAPTADQELDPFGAVLPNGVYVG